MSEFITIPFDQQTPEEIQLRFYDFIQATFPEWEPHAGSLEVTQTEMIAQLLFELFTLAADVPPAIFTYLGSLIKINPSAAKAATVTVTVTANDTTGHVIDANDLLVAWDIGEDTGIGFFNASTITIPNGSNNVNAVLTCEVQGFVGNGLSGTPQIISQLDYLSSVVAIGSTAGGEDAENITDYLNRLSTRLQLLKDRPITGDQVAIWAVTVIDGIERAIGFDNFNPAVHGAGDYAQTDERHTTLSGMDADGADLSGAKVTELLAALALTREINFNFHFVNPTRTQVDIATTVRSEANQDPVALANNIKQSLASAINPLLWGQPTSAQGPTWLNERTLRNRWVYSLVDRVEGVRYVDTDVLMGAHGGALSSADMTLTGLAPVPFVNLADISVTVLPPL